MLPPTVPVPWEPASAWRPITSWAARRLRADEGRHFLTISVSPTFASTWLVRRLGAFKAAFPETDVRLQTTDKMADFARDGVDVSIRFGAGDYPGLQAIR